MDNRQRAIEALKGHGQPPLSRELRSAIVDTLAAAGLLAADEPRTEDLAP